MVLLVDCAACRVGKHDEHHDVIVAGSPGLIGGVECRCAGDCADRYERSVDARSLAAMQAGLARIDAREAGNRAIRGQGWLE